MSKEEQNGNYAKLPVICSDLSYDDWRRLAGHIDNGFFGSEKTFSVERKNGYYYLNTNKCDDDDRGFAHSDREQCHDSHGAPDD
jgi:hypothetical protein